MLMITRKMYIFLVLCVLLVIGCAKKTPSLTVEKGVLSVGVEIGYPPMEYFGADGSLLGFDVDLAKALAEKLNLQVKFIDTAWENILTGLDEGRYDIVADVTVTPERQEKYNFTRPYVNTFLAVVTRKGSPIKIDKPEDLAGYRVAFQGDTTAQNYAERLNNQGINFTLFSYDKINNCFDDLKLDRVDLIVVDNLVAYYYMGTENSSFEIAWFDSRTFYEELIAFCLKKGSDALTAMINKALLDLQADGTTAEISYRYFGRHE
jgi:polar amino acid transport system substrate-binding protein